MVDLMDLNTNYPFVAKLYQIVNEADNSPYVSWSDEGRMFTVWNPSEFAVNVLPKYFKHNNFCSFIRQLNIYGFHKISPDIWEFRHESSLFERGKPQLLAQITRRKQQRRGNNGKSDPSPASELLETKKIKPDPYSPQTPGSQISSHDSSSTVSEVTSPRMFSLSPPSSPSDFSPILEPQAVKKAEDDVGYLKSVNDYLYNELNLLQRKTQTQDNTITWLIQELTKYKNDLETIKKTKEMALGTYPTPTESYTPTQFYPPRTDEAPLNGNVQMEYTPYDPATYGTEFSFPAEEGQYQSEYYQDDASTLV